MRSWLRVSALVKIFFFEFIAVSCLALETAGWLRAGGVAGCPKSGGVAASDFAFFGIGLASAAWLVWRILRPVEVTLAYRPRLTVGPVEMLNPFIAPAEFKFASTHPSYVLVELLIVAAMYPFYVAGGPAPATVGCGLVGLYLFARIGFALALFFPAFRLFSWYVLGRRTSEEAQRQSAKPVGIFLGITAPIVGLLAFFLVSGHLERQRLPLVDAASFGGGLAAHRERSGDLVRVRGALVTQHAERCGCDDPEDPRDCKVASLLLDLGAGGQVVVHAAGSDSDDVAVLGEGAAGATVEAIGRLGPLPDPKSRPFDQLDCGWGSFGPAPPVGRAFLGVEYP